MRRGLKAFTPAGFSPRTVLSKAAAYTVTYSDDQVTVTAAAALTLPAISDMAANKRGNKMFRFVNTHTAANTITPATGETIDGKAVYSLPTNGEIIITANQGDSDWEIIAPAQYDPRNEIKKVSQVVIADTSGTTAVNVFSSDGAPCDIEVKSVLSMALDANAGNIILKNGTNSVCSIAKGTTTSAVVGEESLSNTSIASGAVCTVESSTTNGNSRVHIFFEVTPSA